VVDICENQVFKNTHNQQSVQLAEAYINLLLGLDDKYPDLYNEPELESRQNERESKLKAFFEKCLETFGTTNTQSVRIWLNYIDFEMMRNNLTLVSTLSFMALRLPLEGNSQILNK
jgi:hypothetical protein